MRCEPVTFLCHRWYSNGTAPWDPPYVDPNFYRGENPADDYGPARLTFSVPSLPWAYTNGTGGMNGAVKLNLTSAEMVSVATTSTRCF